MARPQAKRNQCASSLKELPLPNAPISSAAEGGGDPTLPSLYSDTPEKRSVTRIAIWQIAALLFATFSCQAPDIVYEGVKLSEFFAFCVLPFCLSRRVKTPRVFVSFMLSVLAIGVITVVTNVDRNFFILYDSGLLRRPYIITVCRMISLGCCVTTASFFYRSCVQWPGFVRKFLVLQAWLAAGFIGLWLLSFAGIEIVTDGHRLTGFFNEGGPFGLMYGFFFAVGVAINAPVVCLVLFAACVLAAASKAGTLMLVTAPPLIYALRLPRTAQYIVFVLCIYAIPLVVGKVGANYFSDWAETETLLQHRLEDPNFVMGRIAGLHIVPEMVLNNPIFGVGLGNYSLVRNDPLYRGIFPDIDLWDLSGLGGLTTMLAEGGIVGLILILLPFIPLWKNTSSMGRGVLLASLLSLAYGVQLYFAYPWVGIALASVPNLSNLYRRPNFVWVANLFSSSRGR